MAKHGPPPAPPPCPDTYCRGPNGPYASAGNSAAAVGSFGAVASRSEPGRISASLRAAPPIASNCTPPLHRCSTVFNWGSLGPPDHARPRPFFTAPATGRGGPILSNMSGTKSYSPEAVGGGGGGWRSCNGERTGQGGPPAARRGVRGGVAVSVVLWRSVLRQNHFTYRQAALSRPRAVCARHEKRPREMKEICTGNMTERGG